MKIDQVIVTVRGMIHRGEFSRVTTDKDAIKVLEHAASEHSLFKRTCLQATVMLAELYDQTSRYSEAEALLAFDRRADMALQMLRRLTKDEKQRWNNRSEDDRKESRLLVRALAFFCLQHAIAWHRETQDAPHSLQSAVYLANAAKECLRELTRVGYRFDGTLSMFCYWTGRFHLLARNWEEARKCFRDSMQHEQDNLLYHLDQHSLGKHDSSMQDVNTCVKCASRVDYTNYLLASNMAFGLAVIELEEGAIESALILLRAALIMLEGSTRDRYRKGYVRLLIGKAERVRIGANAQEMQRSIRLLEEAARLLTAKEGQSLAHSYYAARSYHQLCLAYIFVARDRRLPQEAKEAALLRACQFFLNTRSHHDRELQAKDGERFIDRYLQVRLSLTKGRLLRELLKVAASPLPPSFYDKLQLWRNSVIGVGEISKTWAACSGSSQPLTADALTARIADELLSSIEAAATLDIFSSAEKGRREYLRIAEAEAIIVIVKYAVMHSRRQIDEMGAAKLVRQGVDLAKGFFEHNELSPIPDQTRTMYVWRDVALAYAVSEMKKLLSSKRLNIKVQATAEVMLARLLLCQGDRLGASRQLLRGWEPIKAAVENCILRDAVEEIMEELGRPESVCSVELDRGEPPPSWKDLEAKLHADIINKLRDQGLKDEAIAKRLGISKATVQNWLHAVPVLKS